MITWFLLFTAVLASAFLTLCLRSYALKNSLIDVPNQRSSHSVPTPRGGGVAVVIVFLISLFFLMQMELIDIRELLSFVGAGVIVAGVGFWDDHGHISARWRLLAHFMAASWGLYWLGGLPDIIFYRDFVDLGWIGQALTLIYLVWLLNLYNFMDGIDGIAGVEAVTVCVGAVLLYFIAVPEQSIWTVTTVMLASVMGFLVWNFPPAKIFMGDAGSGFIGLMLGLFSIHSAQFDPNLLWGWLILLGAFIVDATFTLLRRVSHGEKFYEPHRSHAYQYASRKLGSHKLVTLIFGCINLFWLLPLALLVITDKLTGIVGLLVAYGPLMYVAYIFKAGDQFQQTEE